MRVDIVGNVFLVVEQLWHKSLRINPFLTVCLRNTVCVFKCFRNLWSDALVKVSLEFLARIVMYSDVRVECFDEYLELANNIINENKNLIEFLFDKLKKSEHIGPDEMKVLISEFNNN